MDYPIHIDTICMELSILYFKGLQVKLSINDVLLSLTIVFILANSASLMKLSGISSGSSLPKLTGIQNEKG